MSNDVTPNNFSVTANHEFVLDTLRTVIYDSTRDARDSLDDRDYIGARAACSIAERAARLLCTLERRAALLRDRVERIPALPVSEFEAALVLIFSLLDENCFTADTAKCIRVALALSE